MSASGPPAQYELEPGTRLGGRYRVVRLLGSGGMGAVYEGVQEGLGRRVALKVLHARLAEAPDLVERFRREAQAAAALAHPHIVQVSDAQANAGEPPFLVMEFLDGQSLGDLIRQVGALPADRVVKIAAQVLDGLAAAHRAGIVHRDIKPDNVFLAASSTLGDLVKLVDFGVAKLMDGANAPLTLAGTVIGTLAYMAPEQARGAPIDARTDVYAVAGCMYYALSRHRPLEGRQGAEMLAAIVMDEPPPLSQYLPNVDRELAAIVHRGLQKEPDARYPTADAMKGALTSWLIAQGSPGTSQPPPAAPVWSALAAATLIDTVAPSPGTTMAGFSPPPAMPLAAPTLPATMAATAIGSAGYGAGAQQAPTAVAFPTVVSGYEPVTRPRSVPPPAHGSSNQHRSSTLYVVGALVVLFVVAATAVAVVVALRLGAPRDREVVVAGASTDAASVQRPAASASGVAPASTLALPSTSASTARARATSRPPSAQKLTTGVVPAAASSLSSAAATGVVPAVTKPAAPAASTSAAKLGRATSYGSCMPPAPDGDFASARVQQVVQRRTNQVNACHCDVTAQAPLDTRVQVTLLLNPQGKALQTVTSVDTLAPAYAQCLRFAYQGLEFGKPVHGSGSHLDICIEVH